MLSQIYNDWVKSSVVDSCGLYDLSVQTLAGGAMLTDQNGQQSVIYTTSYAQGQVSILLVSVFCKG